MHHPYVLRFFLLDAARQIAFSSDAKADLGEWLPGDHLLTATLALPATLQPGDYTLAVAVINPTDPSRPFRLAIDVADGGKLQTYSARLEKVSPNTWCFAVPRLQRPG